MKFKLWNNLKMAGEINTWKNENKFPLSQSNCRGNTISLRFWLFPFNFFGGTELKRSTNRLDFHKILPELRRSPPPQWLFCACWTYRSRRQWKYWLNAVAVASHFILFLHAVKECNYSYLVHAWRGGVERRTQITRKRKTKQKTISCKTNSKCSTRINSIFPWQCHN